MKWYDFDNEKGSRQKRPPEKKYVLVMLANRGPGLPCALAVGYMRNAAGDKQRPYFKVPGIGGEVVAWCNCLPDDFKWPSKSLEARRIGYEHT